MTKLFIKTLFVSLFAVWLTSCYSDLGDDGVGEQNLVVALDPDTGNTLVKTFSTAYDFKVLVKSQMPRQGVTVSVVYSQDSDNSVVFSQTYNIEASPLNVQVTDIPFNEVGTVTVTVTSKSSPSNTVTQTFKLVRK
jgi:hypothetical protein